MNRIARLLGLAAGTAVKAVQRLADVLPHPEAPVAAPDPEDAYSADDMPELADIETAAAEYDRAADQARRADRGKRAARKILGRLPAGVYGAWRVSRRPSARQTVDLSAVTATYKRLGLGPVPMKPCAPSLVVERVASASCLVAA